MPSSRTSTSERRRPARSTRVQRSRRVLGTKPSRELEEYTGTYTEPAYGTVKIGLEGDSLVLDWSSFHLSLKHFHYDTFMTLDNNRRLPAAVRAETVVFEMNDDAEFVRLRFLGRTFMRDKSRKKESEK